MVLSFFQGHWAYLDQSWGVQYKGVLEDSGYFGDEQLRGSC